MLPVSYVNFSSWNFLRSWTHVKSLFGFGGTGSHLIHSHFPSAVHSSIMTLLTPTASRDVSAGWTPLVAVRNGEPRRLGFPSCGSGPGPRSRHSAPRCTCSGARPRRVATRWSWSSARRPLLPARAAARTASWSRCGSAAAAAAAALTPAARTETKCSLSPKTCPQLYTKWIK